MTPNVPWLEVAVFTVKELEKSDALQKHTHQELATLPGFVRGIALCGLDDRASRADVILWESEATAKAAVSTIESDERFVAFMQNIESIRHFAHYMGASVEALNRLAASTIIEIAAYEVTAEGGIAELRQQVQEALHDVEGASPQIAGIRTDSQSNLVDLIGWSSKTIHEAAPGILMQRHPEFEPFFSGIEKMEVFELFERVF
ncbi:hypothetical protein IQ273_10630 [Nodosilinea sp. LEGE 07298]|uniref:hypothetical protein n=1 Tax=Nodosilinea sp. LEGE 07298 TaxID=2777970 RepID=UPI00187E724F|nr:hypothetical protein [Nodosilinea sp. LEGE 07298]MBE9109864.1 hypothetical protein [Nodosilinea sp. LEGE 07298]